MREFRDRIKAVLEEAVWSPSGDNCQPWVFLIQQDVLEIHLDTVRAEHVLDTGHMASYLALGSLITAVEAVSISEGLRVELIELAELPDLHASASKESVYRRFCRLRFHEDSRGSEKPEIRDLIRLRCTDRRAFRGVSDKHFHQMVEDVRQIAQKSQAPVTICGLSEIPRVAVDAISDSESLLFDIPNAVKDTAKWIRVRPADVETCRDGMPLRNLGVNFLEGMTLIAVGRFVTLLKTLRPFLRITLRQKVRKNLKQSGLIGFAVEEVHAQSLVEVGRIAMRAWLTFNSRQYGVQPLTLSSLGLELARRELFKGLSPQALRKIEVAAEETRKCLNLPANQKLVWLFRVGKQRSPLAGNYRTLRRPPRYFEDT